MMKNTNKSAVPFESLENKMSSGRFASLNEAELEQIKDSRLSQNTKNAGFVKMGTRI
jgi:hypothetical protein